MNYDGFFKVLNELKKEDKISKKGLILLLKQYGKSVSVYDLMNISGMMRESVKYVQEQYKDQFVEPYAKTFILGMNQLANQNENVEGLIDKDLFEDALDNLEYNFYKETDENNFKYRLIIAISSLYVTFIKEEPLHPVGSIFPGNTLVYEENGIFYCPVKDAQKDNPDALCGFCLAEQTPDLK